MTVLALKDRHIFSISGIEADAFLQRAIVSDMRVLTPGSAHFSALLSPQGKVLVDFFLYRDSFGNLFLDCPSAKSDFLLHTLKVYKLRADITLTDVSHDYGCCVAFGGEEFSELKHNSVLYIPDPRHPLLGYRGLVPVSKIGLLPCLDEEKESQAQYHKHYLLCGVPQGGVDFIYGTVFPTEVLMDMFHALSYDKGCYIGQEVVSRLHHRDRIRSRFISVSLNPESVVPRGADITCEGRRIGQMGSSREGYGLALVRLDRLMSASHEPLPNLFVGHSLLTVRRDGFWKEMESSFSQDCQAS